MKPLLSGLLVVCLWGFSLSAPVPDFLLLVLLFWSFSLDPSKRLMDAVRLGFVVGLLKDFSSSGPFGVWAIVFAMAAAVAVFGGRTIAREAPLTQVAWVTVFSFGTSVVYVLLAGAMGVPLSLPGVMALSLTSSVVTGCASLLLFPVLRRMA